MKRPPTNRFTQLLALARDGDTTAAHDLHAEFGFDFQPLDAIAAQISSDWKDQTNKPNEEK